MICPKCFQESGDAWWNCEGSCPFEFSPHYDPDWKEKQNAEFVDITIPNLGEKQ